MSLTYFVLNTEKHPDDTNIAPAFIWADLNTDNPNIYSMNLPLSHKVLIFCGITKPQTEAVSSSLKYGSVFFMASLCKVVSASIVTIKSVSIISMT